MPKYKCEYYSKVTGKKELAMMEDPSDLLTLIDANNIDCNKEIKILQKLIKWELIYHVVDGKCVLHKLKEGTIKDSSCEKQGIQWQNSINKAIAFFDKDICPSRKENQSHMETIFDHFFGEEDISKPKLEVAKPNHIKKMNSF